MGNKKAYIVSDKWNDNSTVVFAESVGKAKSEALYKDDFDNYEYVELRTKRMKKWDKYAESGKIPISEMLKNGWWFECVNCYKQITEDDIIDGDADIIDYERSDFVQGGVICKECLKKKRAQECR